ncbi:hypothetical protein GCM10023347_07810 [Streptomyces chumphonensis]|uniref:Integrase n=1 Tax=Streptomyces chumphonensis TaxID=1214925 RepID=A0A927IFI9_9ACTN|nr:hypothetical protein [Streptomyces chumphonensis]MBD3934829.1 hypothetical protein [Streptomyces chumphonensis]
MADRSPNTERVYAGRVALYPTYYVQSGMVWNRPGFFELGRFAQWLITEPLPPKGARSTAVRFRSKRTANAVLTTVFEFLRFGSVHGWVPQEVVAQLSEPKYLSFLPARLCGGRTGRVPHLSGPDDQFHGGRRGHRVAAGCPDRAAA